MSAYSNGDSYEGDWVNGLRHGHGLLRCTDGTVYEVSIIIHSLNLFSQRPPCVVYSSGPVEGRSLPWGGVNDPFLRVQVPRNVD